MLAGLQGWGGGGVVQGEEDSHPDGDGDSHPETEEETVMGKRQKQ